MYVKIISKVDGVWYTDTHECKEVSIWEPKEDVDSLLIRLDGQRLLSVDKSGETGNQVFYLNDEGCTIERVL